MWSIEIIPDEDSLYYRVHQNNCIKGKIVPGVFRELGDGESRGMSTDWEKYSTPERLRNVATAPEKNGIVSFIAGKVRNVPLEVVHAPSKGNRAHTNVKGIDVEARLKLLDLFQCEIPVPPKRSQS